MNILKIDTSNNLKTRVELVLNSRIVVLEEERKTPGDQNVLELLDRILKAEKMTLNQINEIGINTGPGSFTGLRVGVSIANALSFGGSITVNKKPLGEIIIPEY